MARFTEKLISAIGRISGIEVSTVSARREQAAGEVIVEETWIIDGDITLSSIDIRKTSLVRDSDAVISARHGDSDMVSEKLASIAVELGSAVNSLDRDYYRQAVNDLWRSILLSRKSEIPTINTNESPHSFHDDSLLRVAPLFLSLILGPFISGFAVTFLLAVLS